MVGGGGGDVTSNKMNFTLQLQINSDFITPVPELAHKDYASSAHLFCDWKLDRNTNMGDFW